MGFQIRKKLCNAFTFLYLLKLDRKLTGDPTKIRARQKEKSFAHPFKCVSYKYASHMLVPIKSRSVKMFRVERKYPEQCWASDMDAFEKTLAFWKEVW